MVLDKEPALLFKTVSASFPLPEVAYNIMAAFLGVITDTSDFDKSSGPTGSPQILQCHNFSSGGSYFPVGFCVPLACRN